METNKIISLLVCDTHESQTPVKEEIGLSVNGYNPEAEDFFEMPVETAIRLREYLLSVIPENLIFKPSINQ